MPSKKHLDKLKQNRSLLRGIHLTDIDKKILCGIDTSDYLTTLFKKSIWAQNRVAEELNQIQMGQTQQSLTNNNLFQNSACSTSTNLFEMTGKSLNLNQTG